MKLNVSKDALRMLTRAGIIAAIYAALTLAVYPISFGAVQFRVSEAMCVLPVFFPEAVPGLFVGCIAANMVSPNSVVLDVIFGSLATLIAALVTRRIKNRYLVPLPSVIANAAIIGLVITFSATGDEGGGFIPTLLFNMLTVGLGEAVVCYCAGLPLMAIISKLVDKNIF